MHLLQTLTTALLLAAASVRAVPVEELEDTTDLSFFNESALLDEDQFPKNLSSLFAQTTTIASGSLPTPTGTAVPDPHEPNHLPAFCDRHYKFLYDKYVVKVTSTAGQTKNVTCDDIKHQLKKHLSAPTKFKCYRGDDEKKVKKERERFDGWIYSFHTAVFRTKHVEKALWEAHGKAVAFMCNESH